MTVTTLGDFGLNEQSVRVNMCAWALAVKANYFQRGAGVSRPLTPHPPWYSSTLLLEGGEAG